MAQWLVAAQQDAADIVNYLDGQQLGVGVAFVLAFMQTEGVIDAQPLAFAVVQQPDRRRALVHHPFGAYAMYYRVLATGPEIMAVLDTRQNPQAIARVLAGR